MKSLLLWYLRHHVRRVMKHAQPTVVAVTGSYGKTTTRRAIEIVLSEKHSVRTGRKNYNNEFGIPFTVFDVESPGRSIGAWLSLLMKATTMRELPRVLLLEYGADHPGDIRALCDLIRPDIAVVTGVSPVHAEYFPNIDALAREKSELVRALSENGIAILHEDDIRVRNMRATTSGKALGYGLTSGNLRAQDVRIATRRDESFESGEVFAQTMAEIVDGGDIGTLTLRNALGVAPIVSSLAAILVGKQMDIHPSEAMAALEREFDALPGRLKPIAGIKGSLILDDSYNAAPAAMQHGLEVLLMFEPVEEVDRRIAVLGQMAELGKYSEQEHARMGELAAAKADILVAVGERMQAAVDAAKQAGMGDDQVYWFATSKEAGAFLDDFVQQGDIVYVKGAQSSRMEFVVKDLMAEPLRAKELLVRQEAKWLM